MSSNDNVWLPIKCKAIDPLLGDAFRRSSSDAEKGGKRAGSNRSSDRDLQAPFRDQEGDGESDDDWIDEPEEETEEERKRKEEEENEHIAALIATGAKPVSTKQRLKNSTGQVKRGESLKRWFKGVV